MKFILLLFFCFFISSAQTKKIDFFGTEFFVNNACIVKESSIKYNKNAMMWMEAPPTMFRGMILSTIRNKLAGKKAKEVSTNPIKMSLLKQNWEGKFSQFKKEGNDSITNFIQLYGNYKEEERLLILVYKTAKVEQFRLPTYFDFLIK